MFDKLTKGEIIGLVFNGVLGAVGSVILGMITLNQQHEDVENAVRKELEAHYATEQYPTEE